MQLQRGGIAAVGVCRSATPQRHARLPMSGGTGALVHVATGSTDGLLLPETRILSSLITWFASLLAGSIAIRGSSLTVVKKIYTIVKEILVNCPGVYFCVTHPVRRTSRWSRRKAHETLRDLARSAVIPALGFERLREDGSGHD
jgi:hypothetical protein